MDTFHDDVPVDWPPENEKLVVKPIRELVLDFETIRCPKAIPYLPEKGPRDRTEPAEKVAFDPNYIQPCVAGFYENGRMWSIGQDHFEENAEQQLLQSVWDELADVDVLITFNGWSFDLPLLLRRSWYHGILPSKRIDLRKYQTGNHVDVRMVLSNWDTHARGNLELYACLKLGTCKTDGIDGSQVQGLWDAGEYAKVHEYCEGDVKITWELYRSLKGFYI